MQQLDRLIGAFGDAIVAVDAHGRITDANQAATAMFGYGRDHMIGAPIDALVSCGCERVMRELLDDAASDGPRPSMEMTGVRRTGERFAVDVALAPRSDGERGVTAVFRDTSSHHELERSVEALFALVAELLTGHVLGGRYALERLVASDPFGAVYEAVDLDQRASVAVRVARAVGSAAPTRRAAPECARSVELLDVGVTDQGLPYAVTEPLTGESLADRIGRGKVIEAAEARAWATAVAEALRDAHACGAVHGRLSAAAVFLHRADTPAQKVVLARFELGALAPLSARMTRDQVAALGAFRPPENRRDVQPTAAGDVYACGVLLGVLYSGSMPPRRGAPIDEWLSAVLPPALVGTAVRAVDRDPAARPDAAELVRALSESRV